MSWPGATSDGARFSGEVLGFDFRQILEQHHLLYIFIFAVVYIIYLFVMLLFFNPVGYSAVGCSLQLFTFVTSGLPHQSRGLPAGQ